MKNFIILLNFLFLLILGILFSLLYYKTNDKYYLENTKIVLNIFAFGFLILLSPKFFEAIRFLKSNYQISKPKKNSEKNIDIIWENFLANLPIPCIIFDSELIILNKNEEYFQLEDKTLMKTTHNLGDVFQINNDVIIETCKKSILNNSKFKALDTKINSSGNHNFTIFIKAISENNNLQKFLCLLIDNSEKLELKEKFIQAQKMQGIGQLAGGIAHDFNNLLTAITGFCDLLITRNSPDNENYADIMQIKQNANRAANLVRQLLAFSRRQTLQMEVLNINDVIFEVSELLKRLIGNGIKLNVNYARDVWDIKADKAQLEQVFVNLVVNARDAMANKKGDVIINVENIDFFSIKDLKFKYQNYVISDDIEPTKYIKISFEDNASGIKRENLKKIFEPFFTTKEVGKGTGLGLATVSGIIQQSGGVIAVSSNEGEGTQFIILLKRVERSVESSERQVIIKEQKLEKQKDLTGKGTILIVEDEDAVRIFSSRALKNKGYNVIEAFSGDNGLEIFNENQGKGIDLIISDVVMPGISGVEMVEKILQINPGIKVIFVSGYGEDVFYQQYGAERKFNFLSKPYSLQQLAEKVKEIL